MESIIIIICSLMPDDRKQLVRYNQSLFNDILVFQSVNGYDREETKRELRQTGLKLHSLDYDGQNFGTLANWLTKYQMIKYQVDMQIPYMCILEDDMQVSVEFKSWIMSKREIVDANNITRLLIWGEGYVLSLAGARNVLECLNRDGVCMNVDNQLRMMCGKEMSFYEPGTNQELPYVLNMDYASSTTIHKTDAIDIGFLLSE